jgi:hypothetical protein
MRGLFSLPVTFAPAVLAGAGLPVSESVRDDT